MLAPSDRLGPSRRAKQRGDEAHDDRDHQHARQARDGNDAKGCKDPQQHEGNADLAQRRRQNANRPQDRQKNAEFHQRDRVAVDGEQ
jgi:hypothetical protein